MSVPLFLIFKLTMFLPSKVSVLKIFVLFLFQSPQKLMKWRNATILMSSHNISSGGETTKIAQCWLIWSFDGICSQEQHPALRMVV